MNQNSKKFRFHTAIYTSLFVVGLMACGSEEDEVNNRLLPANSSSNNNNNNNNNNSLGALNQTYMADLLIAKGQTLNLQLATQIASLCTITNNRTNLSWSLNPTTTPAELMETTSACIPKVKLTNDLQASQAYYVEAKVPRNDGKHDLMKIRLRQRLAPNIEEPTTAYNLNANSCGHTTMTHASGIDVNGDGPKMRFFKTESNIIFRDPAPICGSNPMTYLGDQSSTSRFQDNRVFDFIIKADDPSTFGDTQADFMFSATCRSTAVGDGHSPAFASSGTGCENYCPFNFEFQEISGQPRRRNVVARFKQDGTRLYWGANHFNVRGGSCWYSRVTPYTPVDIEVTVKSQNQTLSTTKRVATLYVEVDSAP